MNSLYETNISQLQKSISSCNPSYYQPIMNRQPLWFHASRLLRGSVEKHRAKTWVELRREAGSEVRNITHYLPDVFKVSFRTLFVQGFICQIEICKQGDNRIESLFQNTPWHRSKSIREEEAEQVRRPLLPTKISQRQWRWLRRNELFEIEFRKGKWQDLVTCWLWVVGIMDDSDFLLCKIMDSGYYYLR